MCSPPLIGVKVAVLDTMVMLNHDVVLMDHTLVVRAVTLTSSRTEHTTDR